ncbi:hypothetical protein Agub_g3644 [Astrephomene gubernaculifera]|uniref:Uncharacterized protein n=1 Tax=Astrephomene gubernaculifera TaxID=47775 RepID=A0AAD3HJD1_9CHLO|nr:hypothetical protein Agub_g3644 [Astrephomene gubernaculifera]
MSPSHGLLLLYLFLFHSCRESLAASLYGLDYNPEDFVVAQPTCVHRLPLAQVSRGWRKEGIRSFVVLNNSKLAEELNNSPSSHKHREAYGYWDDDSIAQGSWRGGNVGDTRAAATPFLAHRHFGDTYKWMLYGDDDTIFYMTGVLKLLSQFDPEQPLALTDNIWYYSLHPSPSAPRCLPCGFNTSSISTNHSFTPRPACPFCTRALACGTYSPRYRCNATHMQHMADTFGPSITNFPAPTGSQNPGGKDGSQGWGLDSDDGGVGVRHQAAHEGIDEDGAEEAEVEEEEEGSQRGRYVAAMRSTVSSYADWMKRHADLKAAYPVEYRFKPAMDWEMRDPPTPKSGSESESVGAVEDSIDINYRRRRRRSRTLLQETSTTVDGHGSSNTGNSEKPGHSRPSRAHVSDSGFPQQDDEQQQQGGQEHRHQQQQRHHHQHHPRRRLAGRYRPKEQPFLDGSRWWSAALGRDVTQDAAELEALRLPYPFCARHDDRLHTTAAPNCLVSISGHGGTGIIFSVGLMRMIAPEDAIAFITKQRGCGGGDCLLGRTLWFRMGIGFTDPGTALQHGAERYEKFTRFIDSNLQMSHLLTLADPTAVLLNQRKGTARTPSCDKACVWLIENVVGTHVRAHNRQVNSTEAAMVKHLRTHARAYEWVMQARADPEVAAGNLTVVKWIQRRYGAATVTGGEGVKKAVPRG